MLLLVRKINRNKWPKNGENEVFELSSDAITGCLRSSRNTISVWKIESEDDLEEATLALAAAGKRLDTFDVVILNGDKLSDLEIQMEQTDGRTVVSDLVNNHFDLKSLNY